MAKPDTPAPRSWLQFSLRGLLVLTTLVAIFLGWREWSQGAGLRQRQAIEQLGLMPSVRINMGPVEPIDWTETWLGIIRPRKVHELDLDTDDPVSLGYAIDLRPDQLHLRRAILTPFVIQRVGRIEQLERLHISECIPGSGDFRPLCSLPRLKSIRIDDTPVDGAAILSLRELPHLEELDLFRTGIADVDVGLISGCQRLETLSVVGDDLSADCMTGLEDLPALKELHLWIEPNDAAFAALDRFPKLESLPWPNLIGVTDGTLEKVCRRFQPTCVRLGPAPVTDEGLAALHSLPDLQQLEVRGIRMTDRGLRTIAELPRLRELTLEDLPVTDQGLANLRPMRQIRGLAIRRTQISGDCFYAFSKAFPKHFCYLESSGLYLGIANPAE